MQDVSSVIDVIMYMPCRCMHGVKVKCVLIRVILRLTLYRQLVLAKSPLRPTTRIFIFQLNTCGYSSYITSSLTRGWVYRLQLLLYLASAFILRFNPAGLMAILLSQIRDAPFWRTKSPYLYPPGTWSPGYTPRYWVPFSSPPTTRKATVEVFDRVSTRVECTDYCGEGERSSIVRRFPGFARSSFQ
jgi:hypothetical protein